MPPLTNTSSAEQSSSASKQTLADAVKIYVRNRVRTPLKTLQLSSRSEEGNLDRPGQEALRGGFQQQARRSLNTFGWRMYLAWVTKLEVRCGHGLF